MRSARKNYVVGSLPKYRVAYDGAEPYIYAVPDEVLIWEGARVVDLDAGVSYDVRVSPGAGRQNITELTLRPIRPDETLLQMAPQALRKKFRGPFPERISNSVVRQVRVEILAELVAEHITAQEQERGRVEDGGGGPIYARQTATGRPSVEQVAADYLNGLGRRQIADKYVQDDQVIDRLLRKARDATLIPKAVTGRKRQTDN